MMAVDLVDLANFRQGQRENPIFWSRLGGRPPLAGARVLDVGCGLGSLCLDIAQAGAAKVVGLDTDVNVIEFATKYLASELPHLEGIVKFHATDPKDYSEDVFDCIVAKDSFEHIMDLEGVLREMKRLLTPGGRVYAGFGPLYKSPFGHHGRILTRLPWRQFPWGHLLESEATLVARANRHRENGGSVFSYTTGPLCSIRDMGLNMHTLREYREIILKSGLHVASFRVNQSKNPVSKLLSIMRKVPILEDYCTHNVYCVLEKTR